MAAVDHLRASGRGQVVNVSSLAGERPTGSSIPYACSKAALSHMTRLLANTLAPTVRVNAVAPGLVDTPWTASGARSVSSSTPSRPSNAPPPPTMWPSSSWAWPGRAYVTGEVVLVDGGLALR